MAVNHFRPGQSGNPTGGPKRPATIEVRRIFRDVTTAARERTQDAIDTLASIMRDPKAPAAARVSAAQALLDRGCGKAAQAIEVNAEPDLTQLSDEDLETLERILRPPDFPTPPLLTRRGRGVSPEEGNLFGRQAKVQPMVNRARSRLTN